MQDLPAVAKMESNIRLVDGAEWQHGGRDLAGEATEWGGGCRPEEAVTKVQEACNFGYIA